jgi:hypothetical protein
MFSCWLGFKRGALTAEQFAEGEKIILEIVDSVGKPKEVYDKLLEEAGKQLEALIPAAMSEKKTSVDRSKMI